MLCFAAVPQSHAQTLNQEDDPIKLFSRAQDAHAKNDYKTAIEFYDAAIRLKPEFPEAEFQRALALLFKDLATLRTDAPLFDDAESLRWQGPTPAFTALAERMNQAGLVERARRAPVG